MKFLRTMLNVLCCGLLVIATTMLVMVMTARSALTDPDPETLPLIYEYTMAMGEDERHSAADAANLATVDTNSGTTIDEVVLRLSEQNYESVATFNKQGEKIADVTSNYASKIRLTTAWWRDFQENDGLIVIHNHPGERSFSPQDLYAATVNQIPLMLVVTSQRAFIVKDIATDTTNNFAKRAQDIMTYCGARRDWWSKRCFAGETFDTMPADVWVSHAAVADTAWAFGFEYYHIPLDDFKADILFEL